jgi:SAM-dependent methyltransferase
MESQVKNILYRQPELYEEIYSDWCDTHSEVSQQLFSNYLNHSPSSILEIGSGTGRTLNTLSKFCSDCIGIDYLSEMVNFSQSKYPDLNFQQGDMRNLRLNRTFEAILCLGWPLNYLLSNEDLKKAFETFVCHCQKGGLLILHIINGVAYLPGGNAKMTVEYEISSGDYAGKAVANYSWEVRHQYLIRERVWNIAKIGEQVDFVKWRVLFPMELEYWLNNYNFKILDMFDDKEFKTNNREMKNGSLYVVARLGD